MVSPYLNRDTDRAMLKLVRRWTSLRLESDQASERGDEAEIERLSAEILLIEGKVISFRAVGRLGYLCKSEMVSSLLSIDPDAAGQILDSLLEDLRDAVGAER